MFYGLLDKVHREKENTQRRKSVLFATEGLQSILESGSTEARLIKYWTRVARSQKIKEPPMSINPPCVSGHHTRAQHQGSKHSEIPQLASQLLSLSCVVLSELLKLLKLWFLPQETVGSTSPLKQDKMRELWKTAHTWSILSLQKWQLLYFCWVNCWVFSLWGRYGKMKSV